MHVNITTCTTIFVCACLALTILLFMASVEMNLGPVSCAELATMITSLTNTVNNGFQECNYKLDALIIDIADLKAKCAVLEATVTQLTNDYDCLRCDLSNVRESGLIPNIVSLEANLVLTGLPLFSLHLLDDIRTFMCDKLHLSADDTADAIFGASINVISNGSVPGGNTLAIVSFNSVRAPNLLQSRGKHLKGTKIFIHLDLL